MRFNFLVAASSVLLTLTIGLVIPANTFSSRDLEAREGLVGSDTADIFVQANLLKKVANAFTPKYHVPGGPGKPTRGFI